MFIQIAWPVLLILQLVLLYFNHRKENAIFAHLIAIVALLLVFVLHLLGEWLLAALEFIVALIWHYVAVKLEENEKDLPH